MHMNSINRNMMIPLRFIFSKMPICPEVKPPNMDIPNSKATILILLSLFVQTFSKKIIITGSK